MKFKKIAIHRQEERSERPSSWRSADELVDENSERGQLLLRRFNRVRRSLGKALKAGKSRYFARKLPV